MDSQGNPVVKKIKPGLLIKQSFLNPSGMLLCSIHVARWNKNHVSIIAESICHGQSYNSLKLEGIFNVDM